MDSVTIVSDGTAGGTKLLSSRGDDISGVTSIQVHKIEPMGIVRATVEFAGVRLGGAFGVENGRAELRGRLAADDLEPSDFMLGESACDPLQEAISSTEIACRSAEGETLVALQEHLVRLLDLQYARLKDSA